MLERLGQRIKSLPAAQLVAAVLFVSGVVSAIDVLTGPDIGFSFFYLLPVSAVALAIRPRQRQRVFGMSPPAPPTPSPHREVTNG